MNRPAIAAILVTLLVTACTSAQVAPAALPTPPSAAPSPGAAAAPAKEDPGAHTLGAAGAPVAIEEFSDFQ